ncbi:MAG: sugar nucleotide-binding protein [Ilumatobacteraceae bacterium]
MARTMLVTGGSGFLGRHLAEARGARAWSWIAPSSHDLDLRDRERVLEHVCERKPSVVVHLAYRRDDARSIVEASANVAEASATCRARLVHLSSDVVFAGREQPYVEDDPPDAVMDYGRWKAEAERRVAAACANSVLVRTSLLYGTTRLAPWQEAIRDRQPVTWFTDELRCPTHAADIAEAICLLARRTDVRGPLHVAAPEPIGRAGLAQAMADWLHLGDGAVRTGAGVPHDRPGRLILDSSRAAALGITCRTISAALR